jgi:hypothetical protein
LRVKDPRMAPTHCTFLERRLGSGALFDRIRFRGMQWLESSVWRAVFGEERRACRLCSGSERDSQACVIEKRFARGGEFDAVNAARE